MEFRELKQAVQRRFNEMKGLPLFQASIDKDAIWNLYLGSYPEGTNPKFRERSEHDCSACRSFIKNAGGIVAIIDGKLSSIWDMQIGGEYQIVVDALADYVKALPIENVFLHSEGSIGIDHNREDFEGSVRTWEHLHVKLPANLQCPSKDIGGRLSEYRAQHDVLLRSLREIKPDAIETVQDLIAQNSLYRGSEKKAMIDTFAGLKREFDKMDSEDLFAWSQVQGPNAFVCRMRNDVAGTLLVDLSEGVELEKAVKSFEDKVSGTNYKRPTSLVTPKMRDAARQTLVDLGLMSALDRRYAKLEDINITNVLFADRNARKRMGDVFDDVVTKGQSTKNFDKVEEVPIEKFISDVLPTAKSLEVFFENKQVGNLVSLIAPCDLTARTMFKWSTPFSWSYNGDVADSIKERVKQAGGNVTGDVCCRLAWYNHDDLDFHMREPGGGHIFYRNARRISGCGGVLDVDMNAGYGATRTPVENIVYVSRERMKLGAYQLIVNQFNRRESTNIGFEVEIEALGIVHQFAYDKAVSGDVLVANLIATQDGIEVVPVLPSSSSVREAWSLKTQNFHPVSAVMLSPNFWDERSIGNKHFFFMLDGCRNDGSARGFYNEFLSSELEPHRKTMEIVGSKMRTEESGDQMSGLGFSSTQRNSLICKVQGSFNRTLKIVF